MRLLLDAQNAAPVLRTLSPTPRTRLRRALDQLREDPLNFRGGQDIKRLDTGPGVAIYRLRVGSWRIAYTVDEAIVVLRIFHRSQGYGWVADLD